MVGGSRQPPARGERVLASAQGSLEFWRGGKPEARILITRESPLRAYVSASPPHGPPQLSPQLRCEVRRSAGVSSARAPVPGDRRTGETPAIGRQPNSCGPSRQRRRVPGAELRAAPGALHLFTARAAASGRGAPAPSARQNFHYSLAAAFCFHFIVIHHSPLLGCSARSPQARPESRQRQCILGKVGGPSRRGRVPGFPLGNEMEVFGRGRSSKTTLLPPPLGCVCKCVLERRESP